MDSETSTFSLASPPSRGWLLVRGRTDWKEVERRRESGVAINFINIKVLGDFTVTQHRLPAGGAVKHSPAFTFLATRELHCHQVEHIGTYRDAPLKQGVLYRGVLEQVTGCRFSNQNHVRLTGRR